MEFHEQSVGPLYDYAEALIRSRLASNYRDQKKAFCSRQGSFALKASLINVRGQCGLKRCECTLRTAGPLFTQDAISFVLIRRKIKNSFDRSITNLQKLLCDGQNWVYKAAIGHVVDQKRFYLTLIETHNSWNVMFARSKSFWHWK